MPISDCGFGAEGCTDPFRHLRHEPFRSTSLRPVRPAPFKVAIAAASYNPRLVDGLLRQVTEGLLGAGVKPARLTVVRVPGSNELPIAAQMLAARHRPDVVVVLQG